MSAAIRYVVVLGAIHERENRFAKEGRGSRRDCNHSIESYTKFFNAANLHENLNDKLLLR